MKYYDKNIESSHLRYLDVNSLYRWSMSENIRVHGFNSIRNTSQLSKDFTKSLNEESDG